MVDRTRANLFVFLAAALGGGAALAGGCGGDDDGATPPGASGAGGATAGPGGSAGAGGAGSGSVAGAGAGGASAGAGGAGGGAIDCGSLMKMDGPPMGGGDPGQLFQCVQTSCATPCADLLDALPGGGGPAGAGGAGGASSPGAALYAERSCATCHGAFGQGASGPNITPSQAAGIGSWTDAQIAASIRDGVAADGSALCASMPRWDASQIDEAGLAALVSFLRGLAPIDVPNAGTLCGSGAGGAGGAGGGGPGGGMGPPVSDACFACLDPSCPEIATILRCFAGGG